MKIYDVTIPLSPSMHVYPGDPAVSIEQTHRIADGDAANVSRLNFGTHTGTHVDAPRHFIDGAMTVDDIPLDLLLGPARVVEVTDAVITAAVLAEIELAGASRVLFKTRNSYLWAGAEFAKEFVYLTKDAAERLVELGVRVVGIDYLSVEKYDFEKPDAHHALLGAGAIIIEGLNLADVEPGDYELLCLPLKVAGGDGAPARVVLRG